MAKSSSLAFVVVAVGGAAIGFLAAQVVPLPEQTVEEAPSENADQPAVAEAVEGLERLTLTERLRGEITSASELNGNDGSRFTRYATSLDEGEIVEISLRGALQGTVALYDDQLQLLDNAPIVRHRIEESGDYVVVVSGVDAHSYGPFSVESRTVELSDADTVAVGEPIDSWLQGESRDITLNIEEAGLYRIEMRSEDFDAYLAIQGPNSYSREDDDSAGNLDARIADFLEPGEYTLSARSAYGDGDGVYTLSVEPYELPGNGELQNDGELTVDESLNGWFSGEALNYQIDIEEAGLYQIEMSASDIDSYLVLEGDNGYYREDDDSAGDLNARIADFLAPGVYELTARTAYGEGSGMFTLSLQPREMPDEELRNEGAITAGETLNGWYSGAPLSYQLEVTESSLVTLEMRSSDFDAFLEINGQGVALSDDDGADGTNARIREPFLPGTYTISARGFSTSGSGLFELSLEMEPADIPPAL